MFLDEVRQKVGPLARKICQEKGFDLVEFNVRGNRYDVQIQVLADKPGGGINIAECVIINKSLVGAIEEEKILPREIFSLEVSSPGVDRNRNTTEQEKGQYGQ